MALLYTPIENAQSIGCIIQWMARVVNETLSMVDGCIKVGKEVGKHNGAIETISMVTTMVLVAQQRPYTLTLTL